MNINAVSEILIGSIYRFAGIFPYEHHRSILSVRRMVSFYFSRTSNKITVTQIP